ncbi:MAG: hypothetical protein A3B66_00440 [Alphaproteobacteria bacterium RIFCSPHIGHO2_02_FULL_46_13]|nr:MAG: hypothetical protein A3B66_00440 [Alphaproteobacteria bacterium RIFCSPHIGHO2_02_FULL_46_13]
MGSLDNKSYDPKDWQYLLGVCFFIIFLIAIFKSSTIWIIVGIIGSILCGVIAETHNDRKYFDVITRSHLKFARVLLIVWAIILSAFFRETPQDIAMKKIEVEFEAKKADLLWGLEFPDIKIKMKAIADSEPFQQVADGDFLKKYENAVADVKKQQQEEDTKWKNRYLNDRAGIVSEIKEFLKSKQDRAAVNFANKVADFRDKEIENLVEKARLRVKKEDDEIAKFEAESAARMETLKQQDALEEKMKSKENVASIKCEYAVRNSLIAPSTADFPLYADYVGVDPHTKVFTVKSYVDAQNTFGAMIRSNYICKVYWSADDTNIWQVKNVQMN